MSYNTTPRRRFSEAQRAAFLLLHQGLCYWCSQPITAKQAWDIEHRIARELLPGKDADADDNLGPIHREVCHKAKTRADRKLIAKSNRIRRANGPVDDRRKPKKAIRGRPFQPQPKSKWPSRPFQSKGKTP